MNMELADYRPSFNIAMLSADASLSHRFMTVMAVEGYTVRTFTGYEQIASTGKEFPPHIILLEQSAIKDLQVLKKLNQLFPETYFYTLGAFEGIDQIVGSLGNFKGIIPQGKITGRVLTALLDNAIEQLLTHYELEKRKSGTSSDEDSSLPSTAQIIDVQDFSSSDTDENLDKFVDWVSRVSRVEHFDEAIKSFSVELLQHFECSAVIYFKYLSAYASLVAAHSEGVPFQKVRGLGLNFAEDRLFDSSKDLQRMDEHRPFVQMIRNVVDEKKLATSTLVVDGQVRGLFAFVGVSPAVLSESYFKACENILTRWLSEVVLKEKIYSLQRHDELTGSLNKRTFSDQVYLEVGRARRIKLPASYVYISIDNIQQIKKELNSDRYKTLLKMVAKVIEQSVRKTDSVGRMAENEFAILFPHMSMKNLTVKATRLKRLLETAKYFNDLKKEFHITTTVCISEYPTTAYDAEDLMLTAAQKVLSEENTSELFVISKGENFVPDFDPSQGG